MEIGESHLQDPPDRKKATEDAGVDLLKLNRWSSQSSVDAGINDSAKQMRHVSPPVNCQEAQPIKQPAANGCQPLLREPSSSGLFRQNGGMATAESALGSTFDPAKLFSTAAQPSSEAGDRSQLNTQAAFFDAEEHFGSQLAIEDEPRGLRSSSWKTSQVQAFDTARKPPIEDSALEADHAEGTDALEKLWPLMAAVQRRQTSSSCPAQSSSAPAFRLTSAYPSEARRLTRAQAEFLGNPNSKSITSALRSAPTKQPGFFSRQTSSSAYSKSLGRAGYESLRLLDSRKERRMDPQERVRLWLEQGEPWFLSCAAPDWEKHNELPGRSRSVPSQIHRPLKSRQKPTPLKRLFSCFAI